MKKKKKKKTKPNLQNHSLPRKRVGLPAFAAWTAGEPTEAYRIGYISPLSGFSS